MAQVGQRLIVQVARDAAALGLGFVGQSQPGFGQFYVRLFERAICRRQTELLAEGQGRSRDGDGQERRQQQRQPLVRRALDSQANVEGGGVDQVAADRARDYRVQARLQIFDEELRVGLNLRRLLTVLVEQREFILELAGKRLAADTRDFEQQAPRRMRQRQFGRQVFRQIDSIGGHQTPDLQPRLDLARAMARDPAVRAYPELAVRPGREGEDLLRRQPLFGVEAGPDLLIRKHLDQAGVLRGDPYDFARRVVLLRLARHEQ